MTIGAAGLPHLMVMLWLGREACAMENGKWKMENWAGGIKTDAGNYPAQPPSSTW